MNEQQVCSNFQIDLTAAFGICKNCNLPKIQHKISNQSANPSNYKFSEKKHILEKSNAPVNPEKLNDNLIKNQTIIKENNEQIETCKNFQIDLTGDFGKCRNCKQPKINHETQAKILSNFNVPDKNIQIKLHEEKLVVNPAQPRKTTQTKLVEEKHQQPCNDFKLSLAGEYGTCANCSFTKHQHSDEAIFKKSRGKGNSIANKTPEVNEIKIPPKEEKKEVILKSTEKQINFPEKVEALKIQNPHKNLKANEKVEELAPCSNFKLDLAGEFGKCQNCTFSKVCHSPEAYIPKPIETKKNFNIPKNDDRIIHPEPKLTENKEEANFGKIEEKKETNIKSASQNLQKRDSFNVNLKKTFEHEKLNQVAAPIVETTEDFAKCEKFEIDLLGEFGICKNCKNQKNKHDPEAFQQNKKTSLVVKANATFLNSNNKEKAKENEAYLEIKTKKDSVKDKAMILENLEFDPLEKSAKNSFNKISIEDNEGGFAKANLVVSEDSKFKTIRESSDKFEIFKDSDAKTTMPQKKPKSSAIFVPDLRKSNISFEKKITPITSNSANSNASEKKNENQLSHDMIEEETLKKKNDYTLKEKQTLPLHEELDEDFVTKIHPASHPAPPQFSNNLKEDEALKKKSFNAKKPLFDDDDDDDVELEIKEKNNNAKVAVEKNLSQAKKKVLFSDSEESEQNSSEEFSDEEDKKKKMEMKAKFSKAFLK